MSFWLAWLLLWDLEKRRCCRGWLRCDLGGDLYKHNIIISKEQTSDCIAWTVATKEEFEHQPENQTKKDKPSAERRDEFQNNGRAHTPQTNKVAGSAHNLLSSAPAGHNCYNLWCPPDLHIHPSVKPPENEQTPTPRNLINCYNSHLLQLPLADRAVLIMLSLEPFKELNHPVF